MDCEAAVVETTVALEKNVILDSDRIMSKIINVKYICNDETCNVGTIELKSEENSIFEKGINDPFSTCSLFVIKIFISIYVKPKVSSLENYLSYSKLLPNLSDFKNYRPLCFS